ncbi:MAG TPA: TonB-dependent receptor [Gammaproteobacteria bacterium]|jgi:iron complex outermembrane receptor protein
MRLVISVAVLAAVLPVRLVAQPPERAAGVEEITVTARRVEENLQDTPIAVSVYSGDALAERQVFETTELDQLVPNLQFADNAPLAGNNNSSQVFIRGIGQTDPTSTVDPGVGLYMDDVYIGSAVGATMGLRDIASIQTLRGPQGTLFGRNTIGGAILVTTNQPGDEAGGTLRGTFGSDSLIDGFAAFDAPFSDNFKSRFSIGMRQQDGYVTRTDGTDLGDTDVQVATAKFAWTPGDNVTATFALDYTKTDENGSPLVFAAINEAQTFPRVASYDAGCPGMTDVAPPGGPPDQNVPMIQDDRCANDLQARGPFANNGTYPLTSELEETGVSANIAVDLNDTWVFKSISSARNLDWAGNRDADNTPLRILHTLYDVDGSQWSQEFQLTMQSEALTGVIGVYYFQQDSEDIVTVQLNTPAPGFQTDSDNNTVDNDSWAAFTQWTFALGERLDVTFGGRYTEETKRAYPDQYDFANPTVKQVPVQWYEDTFDDFTPSASLSYRWSDQGMGYVSYSEGFKGGGWNSHWNAVLTPAQQAQIHPFKPEYAETIEVGFKLDLAGDTFRLNGAVFSSDYTDMQITYRGPAPAGVAPFLTNAGKAGIDGAELEATWVPTEALIIEASIGVLDAALENLDNVPAGILPPGLVVGNALPFAPDQQAHFGIGYDARPGNLVLTPRLDVAFTDRMFFDATNTPEIAQLDSVTVVNASFALAPSAGNWRFILGVNNATDELYPIGGNSSLTSGAGYAEIAYARPREYYATFNYDF